MHACRNNGTEAAESHRFLFGKRQMNCDHGARYASRPSCHTIFWTGLVLSAGPKGNEDSVLFQPQGDQGMMAYLLWLLFLYVMSTLALSPALPRATTQPAVRDFPTGTQSLFNATSSLFDTRCILPDQQPMDIPVNLTICRPAITRLLLQTNVNHPRLFYHHNHPIPICNFGGCKISIDTLRSGSTTRVATRKVVDSAIRVLLACEGWGHGGWTDLDGDENWITIVQGSAIRPRELGTSQ